MPTLVLDEILTLAGYESLLSSLMRSQQNLNAHKQPKKGTTIQGTSLASELLSVVILEVLRKHVQYPLWVAWRTTIPATPRYRIEPMIQKELCLILSCQRLPQRSRFEESPPLFDSTQSNSPLTKRAPPVYWMLSMRIWLQRPRQPRKRILRMLQLWSL